jgi:hypothetical protein
MARPLHLSVVRSLDPSSSLASHMWLMLCIAGAPCLAYCPTLAPRIASCSALLCSAGLCAAFVGSLVYQRNLRLQAARKRRSMLNV